MTAASSKRGPVLRLQFPSGEIPTLARRYSYEQDEHVIRLGDAARNSGYFSGRDSGRLRLEDGAVQIESCAQLHRGRRGGDTNGIGHQERVA